MNYDAYTPSTLVSSCVILLLFVLSFARGIVGLLEVVESSMGACEAGRVGEGMAMYDPQNQASKASTRCQVRLFESGCRITNSLQNICMVDTAHAWFNPLQRPPLNGSYTSTDSPNLPTLSNADKAKHISTLPSQIPPDQRPRGSI
ncbi:hypothetical protein OG21DRAFT_412082 [Imleria badia]|nr:hypothetical protein OG21DRAFT_412082 [Imleria badia]